ncbi:MAG: 4-hydroxy-tetrahydrodipicolinate synthase [Proteobacteria bacterium]|nr:4-hydroxy-tetrahydrodipicolinate synthase [Pseudomonadota bacterium]
MNVSSWHGAWAAIPTPFHDTPDLDALTRHICFLLHQEIDGIVVVGTTGEAATMTADEKAAVIAKTVEVVDGRVPVIAGVGTNDTRTTIENVHLAKALGVDGLLVVTPYYNKPNQEGQYRHFMAVADASDLPMLIYNVPGRTGTKCLPETLGRLARHPNIVGTKDATGDMVFASKTRMAAGESFLLFSGDDGTVLPFVACGGVGAISVVADIAPKLMHDMIRFALAGNAEDARKLHQKMLPLCDALFSTTSPIPLKTMLSRGHIDFPASLRLPLCEMTPKEADALCAPFEDFIREVKL